MLFMKIKKKYMNLEQEFLKMILLDADPVYQMYDKLIIYAQSMSPYMVYPSPHWHLILLDNVMEYKAIALALVVAFFVAWRQCYNAKRFRSH